MQYHAVCLEILKSAAKISKPFDEVFMDTLKLFLWQFPARSVPFRLIDTPFSEQIYPNNFENETFYWFAFNDHLIRRTLTGKLLVIAVNLIFLSKSGRKKKGT